jgi:hypothetical protein
MGVVYIYIYLGLTSSTYITYNIYVHTAFEVIVFFTLLDVFELIPRTASTESLLTWLCGIWIHPLHEIVELSVPDRLRYRENEGEVDTMISVRVNRSLC